jgi:hypothetical protein
MKFETTPTAISDNHDYPPVESLGVVGEELLTPEQLTRVEAFIDPWHQKKIIEAARLLQVHRPLAQMHSSEYDPIPPYSIIQSPAITRATLTNERCADTLKRTIEEHTNQTGEYFNVLTLCFPDDNENAALVTFVGEEGRQSFERIYYHPDQINCRNVISIGPFIYSKMHLFY